MYWHILLQIKTFYSQLKDGFFSHRMSYAAALYLLGWQKNKNEVAQETEN